MLIFNDKSPANARKFNPYLNTLHVNLQYVAWKIIKETFNDLNTLHVNLQYVYLQTTVTKRKFKYITC